MGAILLRTAIIPRGLSMANESHVKELLKGVKSWNAWREANPDIKPDLSGVDLTLEAVRGTPLVTVFQEDQEFVDLQGFDFHGANLFETNLQSTNLRNANLQTADLGGANLQSADLTDANLHGTKLWNANLQSAVLYLANLQSSDAWGANLGCADLWGVNLQGADLLDANLQTADLGGANLNDANVTLVRFNRSTLQRGFQGIRVATCYGSQAFKSFAQDQDFIEELRDSGRGGLIKFWLWYIFADCGRSFVRWAGWSLFLAILFGIVYYWMGSNHIKPDPPLPFSLITMIYYSVVTFTTLGFGDVKPQTELAAVIVMFEVMLGYVMLGGLISILANKLARRA
jgi:uncharacterized protein YjbI with pentapeptide repeats